jgi:hypothetical protein
VFRVSDNEYRFDDGYRVVVTKDKSGRLEAAQAYDGSGKPVPTIVRPRSEMEICVPKPDDWKSPRCEPLTSMPFETYFKSSTHTTCYMDMGGYFIAYQC